MEHGHHSQHGEGLAKVVGFFKFLFVVSVKSEMLHYFALSVISASMWLCTEVDGMFQVPVALSHILFIAALI